MIALPLTAARLLARPSGALWWPDQGLLVVGDLHFGRAERLARQGAGLLPPYDTGDTLVRLAAEVTALAPAHVLCLGDSFDDLAAAGALPRDLAASLETLAAGRRWTWVAGNHDPGPVDLPGSHLAEITLGGIAFRHIAAGAGPEVSAHYHPKATVAQRGIRITRRCFLADDARVILPAFGSYVGGLDARDPAFDRLLGRHAQAVMLGPILTQLPRHRLG